MKLLSWNVNGLRAVLKRSFRDFLVQEQPDVLCLQEVKASAWVVEGDWHPGYQAFWNSGCRAGYSGTLTLTRRAPVAVFGGIGEPEGDAEGRVLTTEFASFFLVNVYTPNSQNELARLPFRTGVWDPAFRRFCLTLEKRKPVVFCGDLNVAHQEIDIARPASNRRNAGFTDEERAQFTAHLEAGYLDSFRVFNQEPGHYSWWSQRAGARERNVGWRIDYFCVSQALRQRLQRAWILPEVTGSDHCPVGIELAD